MRISESWSSLSSLPLQLAAKRRQSFFYSLSTVMCTHSRTHTVECTLCPKQPVCRTLLRGRKEEGSIEVRKPGHTRIRLNFDSGTATTEALAHSDQVRTIPPAKDVGAQKEVLLLLSLYVVKAALCPQGNLLRATDIYGCRIVFR